MVRCARHRTKFVALLVAALALRPVAAAAETPRERAIELADEGSKLLETKNYAGAVEKFDAAFALVAVPVFALQSANALEMAGRFVEALGRFRAASEMKPEPSWSKIQHDAQATARERQQRLAARTPRLIVAVSGGPAERVELDGREATPNELAAGVLVDPGEHRVIAHAGTKSAEQLVALTEGQTRRIELVLPSDARSVASAEKSSEKAPPMGTGAPPASERSSSSAARTIGWVALGAGAAGVVVGGVSGLMALGKKSDLEAGCPDHNCPETLWEDNDTYDRLRIISTIGFVIGGIGIATGGVLIWTSPAARSTGRARLGLRALPGRMTISGEF